MTSYSKKVAVLAIVFVMAGAAVGCGSDDVKAGDSGGETTAEAADKTTTEAEDEPAGETTTEAKAEGGETVVVTATDYEFEVPESVPVGTKLVIDNKSDKELHEMVVIRIPDEEKRPIEELVELPEAELDAIFGQGPPAVVALQAPGGEVIPAVGDGTLSKPGRYALVCFIPVGVDPQEYLEASEKATDGPPQIEGAGPPHTTQGMYAELTVE